MSPSGPEIDELSQLVGLSPTYVDAFGKEVAVDADRRAGVLGALGYPARSAAELTESLERARRERGGPLPPTVVVTADRPAKLEAAAGDVQWRLELEAGPVLEGARRGATPLALPALPAGYHRIAVTNGAGSWHCTVIAAPDRCWQPGWMTAGERAWGLAAQVYGLRSNGDLGIGSYSDIRRAAVDAAGYGAAFLGLSPLHALFQADRGKISPYSPSSRLFLETVHIDPRAVPGFSGKAARLLDDPERAARIEALRGAALVDHAAVWAELSPVLEALWTERREPDAAALAAFRKRLGEQLERHATFEALSEHFRAEGAAWLGEWPAAYRDPDSDEIRHFIQESADRISYHAWLQMLADDQLGQAARASREAGMSIGLYRDLAVGSDRGGSEVWAQNRAFCLDLSIGAPPDLLAPSGQDWGLPPLNPTVLAQTGLAAFRDLVRANMRHAGAIRIDHAFQLQRLYLIPVGKTGAAGAYVDYPFDAMLAVLRVESHRARALVIAEDLGTGPEGFSDALMGAGILSYRVLAFERGEDGGFKPPAEYPRQALATVTTHDLPTFAGWWRGLDTDLRQALGLYDPERAEAERASRQTERAELVAALAAEGLAPVGELPEAAPTDAVLRYLARTPSVLTAVPYEDVIGSLYQPNMPGTTDGHPNWQRKLEATLDTIDAAGGPLAKLGSTFAEGGRGAKGASGTALAGPPPRATYRIQFHKDFTFDDARKIVPYLARLGISHLYASPIQTARPGSTHGYDIVDHSVINPELGGEEGFLRLSDTLREHGLGLVLDIVPNHMGVGGADNRWWLSVLEWGGLSPQAETFDIDWERLGAGGKLVVPVMGERYGVALEKGDLKLVFDPETGSFAVWHFEHKLPLSPLSYPLVLDRALAALDELEGHAEVIAVSDRLRSMADETSPDRRAAFPAEAEELKGRLASAVAASPALRRAIDRAVAVVNGVPGLPESFGTLHRILEMQAYRPAHWRVAASDINYRRFFDINGLGGIRVELPEVFRQTHELVFRLVREGRIQGLRIDHVDGLADPEGYLRMLQAEVGPGFYVVVEKILEPGEALRPWPISGTTGYDVLNQIDGVLIDGSNGERFAEIYREFAGQEGRYFDLLRAAKTEILQSSFASELEVLLSDLKRIADGDRRTRDYTIYGMRVALSEIIARFPVYRSYLTDAQPSEADIRLIEETVAGAKRRSQLPDLSVHDFAADALLGRIETSRPGRPDPEHVARFRRRFQQLTGPVMAKSLEDTLFYRYGRLIALNEVGGDPADFGISVEHFHALNEERGRLWPDSMIATSTHDTKRGEDARARLAALSELPDDWATALETWQEIADPHLATSAEGGAAPDPNDQLLLLQTLLSSWPVELLDRDDADEAAAWGERLHGFVEKSLREAKVHTSWVNPDSSYEKAELDLVDALLKPGSAFWAAFRPLARRLAEAGMRNGLARTALKLTLPGVPDTYQGTEFWDFSLVDPDNRRPVDYAGREAGLGGSRDIASLIAGWPDGRIKQALTGAILADRAEAPTLYATASYRPLAASGEAASRVLAFAREAGLEALVCAVERLPAGLRRGDDAEPWGATTLAVPPGRWRDILTGHEVSADAAGVPARELFERLPVAVLRRTA